MAANRQAMMMHEPSGKRMQECRPRPRTKGGSLRSANTDVGRRARKETTDLPRRMLDRAVRHDSNSTFDTCEDLDLAESDRMMSKRPPASTKISILEKALITQPTNVMLQQQEQMALHRHWDTKCRPNSPQGRPARRMESNDDRKKIGRRHALIICPPAIEWTARSLCRQRPDRAVADQGKWIDYTAIENRAEVTQCCSDSPKANPKLNVESNMIQDVVFVRPESRHLGGLAQAETAVADVLEAKRKLREGEMMGEGRQESQGPSLFNGL
ncbi:hypothetical protein B0H13DRAFT_1852341 [Mycena leptocephala]|nr:hypothetical protein B0H13DRAFT_1852341 [Mycena leptocephala]